MVRTCIKSCGMTMIELLVTILILAVGIMGAMALQTKMQQSDIQLLASIKQDDSPDNPFVKNGYYMETLPFILWQRLCVLCFLTRENLSIC